MGSDAFGSGQLYGLALGLLVMVAVVLVRNSRPRRLRLEAMWIRPLVILALLGLALAAAPPPLTPTTIAVLGLSAALGVAIGWLRGSLMRIDVHPETHDISARASPAGMLFILAVLGARLYLRNAAASGSIVGLPTAAAVDALILLAGAMLTTQNLEMWLRARRLLGEARAASTAPGSPTTVS